MVTIRPLKGKYYGTEIDIVTKCGNTTTIKVWICNGIPSDRELALAGLTMADWENDKEIDDGWGGKIGCRTVGDIVCDNHYESELSLRIAQRIAEALNDI